MVIKCPVCGEENPDDATICKACGAPLGNSSEKKAKSGKVLIAIFIFAILVVVAIVAAPIIYKSVPNNHHAEDSDGDGMPDWWEMKYFGNLSQTASGDPDGDGLINYKEVKYDTDPRNPDTDGDGVEDGPDWIPKADAGIWVRIDSIRINDPVDFNSMSNPGEIFARIYVDDVLVGDMPSEPAELEIDKVYNVNWSVYYNVSDDRSLHKVRIELYDKNLVGKEMLDINGDSPAKPLKDPSGYYLEINYFLGGPDVGRSQTNANNPDDGSNDGNSGLQDDKDAMIEYTITTIDMSTV